ncbi:MAG: Rieske 2Fe-2S domain-containing protein [Burkholderiales bacterium]|nr:Rieske 2Fe-2S domain-containing protein [Burkholderiales bacterium]
MNQFFVGKQAIQRLVEADRVHRDLYVDPALFALEQQQLFRNVWQFLGHESQAPQPGDCFTQDIAGQPLLAVRQPDGQGIRVFMNRCPHKGAKLVSDDCANLGRVIRCPYHAWSFKPDGTMLGLPLSAEYGHLDFEAFKAGHGLTEVRNVVVYRGFVFVRLAERGVSFEDCFGEMLAALDKMADRSPAGRLSVAGGRLRTIVDCNWKIYLENINDTVHVVTTHESVGRAVSKGRQTEVRDEDAPPMSIEQLAPFAAPYDFYDGMRQRALPGGHSMLGGEVSIHSGYGAVPEYEQALRAAHGEQRAAEVLAYAPQNVVFYPSLSIKTSPQAIRVIRPLAVDRTLIEAWSFRAEGAPELLLERTLTYNRLAFSPMSVVAHDDVHIFRSIQQGLAAEGNPWISLHRGFDPNELEQSPIDAGGRSELLMRNQYRAWLHLMTMNMEDQP